MGRVGAAWGIAGVVALITEAIVRLFQLGLEIYSFPLGTEHWVALWLWVPFMAWSEGYRGFHRAFSPMVAARARYLRDHPHPLHVALAPIFCLGLIHATRQRMVRSTTLTIGIVTLVILVRLLEQPWRGIIDMGVVVGLTIGLASLIYFIFRAFRSEDFDHPPEVPDVRG